MRSLSLDATHYSPAISEAGAVHFDTKFGSTQAHVLDIALQDTTHIQLAALAQRRCIAGHIGDENIAVDICQNKVVLLALDSRRVAQNRHNAVGNAILGDVLAGGNLVADKGMLIANLT